MNPRTSAGRNKLAGVIAEKTVRRVRVPGDGTYRVRQARDKTWTRPPVCVEGERTPGSSVRTRASWRHDGVRECGGNTLKRA